MCPDQAVSSKWQKREKVDLKNVYRNLIDNSKITDFDHWGGLGQKLLKINTKINDFGNFGSLGQKLLKMNTKW